MDIVLVCSLRRLGRACRGGRSLLRKRRGIIRFGKEMCACIILWSRGYLQHWDEEDHG